MAASATMTSILANPVTRLSNRPRSSLLAVPSKSVLRLQRNANMQVRCMAEPEGQKVDTMSATTPPPSSSTVPLPSSYPSVLPTINPVEAKTGFFDIFSFGGLAPERINGRLAMIGFIASMAAEIADGEDVFEQIGNGGVPYFVGICALLSLASVIPLFKGVSVQSKSDGFMTSEAELWNGRVAMLGFVGLAFTEYAKGSALL